MSTSSPLFPRTGKTGFWRRKLTARAWGGLIMTGIAVYLVLPPSEGCACGTPRGYRSMLKAQLRLLAIAEESFFADSIRYTANLAEMGFQPDTGVRVAIDTATGLGYRAPAEFAEGSHPVRRRAGSCVIWAGQPFAVETVPEGEPRCWVPRRPLWRFGAYRSPGATLQ
jgi:hypothetical protein